MSEKKEFNVCVPITGFIWVTVEAEDKESAIEAAFESDDLSLFNCDEWEPHKQICQGNVLHASVNEAFAQEV